MTEELKSGLIPEWYRTERETEKTLNKLGSVKELDFYLKNPDEHIRRLAVLRLYKITDKDSLYVLKELLDDPVETDENKYLAAWVLKSLYKRSGNDVFLISGFIGDFTGDESYDDLFKITSEDSSPIRFDFKSFQSISALNLDKDESTFERDKSFNSQFDLKKWAFSLLSRHISITKKALNNFLDFILKLPKITVRWIINFFKKLKHLHSEKKNKIVSKPVTIKKEPAPKKKRKDDNFYGIRNETYTRQKASSIMKEGFFNLFYILFFPYRFVRKHKLLVFCSFLSIYIFLANTDYGRAFTLKYASIDLNELQNNTVKTISQYSSDAFVKLNDFLGVNDWKKRKEAFLNSDSTDISNKSGNMEASNGIKYAVTAKSGLNIRKLPDYASERIGNSLVLGSTVIFLSKTKKDSVGNMWYYIKAEDSRLGWVNAKFLKEIMEG